jgi:hypothetical protein
VDVLGTARTDALKRAICSGVNADLETMIVDSGTVPMKWVWVTATMMWSDAFVIPSSASA